MRRICEYETLEELNLSNNSLLAKDLSELMEDIEQNDTLR